MSHLPYRLHHKFPAMPVYRLVPVHRVQNNLALGSAFSAPTVDAHCKEVDFIINGTRSHASNSSLDVISFL